MNLKVRVARQSVGVAWLERTCLNSGCSNGEAASEQGLGLSVRAGAFGRVWIRSSGVALDVGYKRGGRNPGAGRVGLRGGLVVREGRAEAYTPPWRLST
jgi:hypothetical protein